MTHTAGYPQLTDRQPGPPEEPGRGLPTGAWLPRESRRREIRYGAGTLRVQSPVFGIALEVSPGGLRLESISPLVMGGRYIFRLTSGTSFFHLPGRVVWCLPQRIEITRQGPRTIYQTGIELCLDGPDRHWRAALASRACLAIGASGD